MESFIKIGPLVWAVEMTQTDTQTHRQTDTQTDTLGSIATYSVKLTEYKNRRRRRPAPRSGDSRREKKTGGRFESQV